MVTALGCVVVLLSVPRAVPLSLPVLELDPGEVRAYLSRERALAARAPDSPAASQLYDLLLKLGRRQLTPAGQAQDVTEVSTQLSALQHQLGSAGSQALRARAADRFMMALAGDLSDVEEARGLLGEQPALLMTHGYLAPTGELLAPDPSVRATYKVRWNMLSGRPPMEGLAALESLAYEGFRALEARAIPPDVRSRSLIEFARLRGKHAGEALAIWRAQLGQPAQLIELGSSAEQPPALRIRNMALGFLGPAPSEEASDY